MSEFSKEPSPFQAVYLQDKQPAINEARPWLAAQQLFDWLQTHQRGLLLASIGLQLVVLLGLIAVDAKPLLTGETVQIKVVPIDPRDLLRGDYVILSYEFSRVNPDQIAGFSSKDGPYRRNNQSQWKNRTVYVSLVRESAGEYWKAEAFSFEKPESGMFIRGQMSRYGRLTFGIEQYYVQAGTGRKYERAIRSGEVSASVAIDSDGRAKLRELRID